MFDGRFRTGVDRATRPVGSALRRTGLSPDHLTGLGLVLAVPAAIVIGSGHLWIGLVLLILAAVPDLLDGALAKASGRSSVRGAFFDSVADRVTDGLVLGGVAWYLQDRHHGHMFLLPMAVLGASLLISYERAKAESLGFDAKGGVMERAERIIVLCVGLLLGFLLVPLLWVMLALTLFTAAQRFMKVWRQATVAGKATAAAASAPGEATTIDPLAADVRAADVRAADVRAADVRVADLRVSDVAVTESLDVESLEVESLDVGAPVEAPTAAPAAADAPLADAAARWRAWREANGFAARPGRFAHGTQRSGAAGTWRERRQARLEDRTVVRGGARRRRSGSRRP